MSRYPVEALLRPPVEYFSAATYLALALLAVKAPGVLMMTPGVAYLISFALVVRGFIRYRQGARVRRYQKGLRRLKSYVLPSRKIPFSRKQLFLGMGFEWDGRHTQRMADLTRKEGRRYKQQSILYRWARRFEQRYEHNWLFRGFEAITGKITAMADRHRWFLPFVVLKFAIENNPLSALPPIGGESSLHAVGLYEGEQPIYIDLGERVGHTLVLGTTRVGKTRLAELLISQDIARGDVTIVFDPKGDSALFRRMYAEAKRAGRLDNFYFFHLGYPEISARYNPVGSFTQITEVPGRITAPLPSGGQSAAFRDFVWRYTNVIAKAQNSLGRQIDYEHIKYFGQDIEPLVSDYFTMLATRADPSGRWRREVDFIADAFNDKDNRDYRVPREMASRDISVVSILRYCKDKDLYDDIASSLARTYEYDRGYYDKLVSSLLPLMEKLTTGPVSQLLSPDYLDTDDKRPIFSWDQIFRSRGIVYIGLNALTNPEVAAAVGGAMFSDLTSKAGRLYIHGLHQGLPDIGLGDVAINIHADEFNELIGPEFIPMLNKAGGAGYQVTAYTQTWSDVEAKLQDKAKAGQVAGNFNTIIMLRVREDATAEMLTGHLRQVEINHLLTASRANDSSDPDSSTHFTSGTEQRITTQQADLVHINDIITLPKGQAFALLNGGRPHKIRLPLPDDRDLKAIPNKLCLVAKDMQEKYTTSTDWYRFDTAWQETA